MIRVEKDVIKKQPKFWNHALFHPTDTIHDTVHEMARNEARHG